MWKLVYPFSLCIIQPLLESIHYGLINSLDLPIPLGVSWSRREWAKNLGFHEVANALNGLKMVRGQRKTMNRQMWCAKILPRQCSRRVVLKYISLRFDYSCYS